ncbi:MAG: paraslipin, partial [Planctomycetia bacterium]
MEFVAIAAALAILLIVLMGVRIVPQQSASVVERLGRFNGVLTPGLNVIIPFIDKIAYRHTLKEVAVDIPEQVCVTKDNVQVAVDGVVFLQVVDPKLASYGIANYHFAVSQLAQTTMRSEIGKIVLDKCFEERSNINAAVV